MELGREKGEEKGKEKGRERLYGELTEREKEPMREEDLWKGENLKEVLEEHDICDEFILIPIPKKYLFYFYFCYLFVLFLFCRYKKEILRYSYQLYFEKIETQNAKPRVGNNMIVESNPPAA